MTAAANVVSLFSEIGRLTPADRQNTNRRGAGQFKAAVVDFERSHQRHRARFLGVGEAVDHAVLQHLELADRHAELLAGLDVFQRGRVDRIHAAGRLGAQRHDRAIDGFFDGGERVVDRPQHRIGADRDLVEGQLRCPQRILGRVVAPRQALGLAVDQEEREALLVARAAAGAGEHDDGVGRRRVVDDALVAGERPAGAFLGRLERDVGEIVAALALQPGEGELLLALDHRRQQRLLLRRGAGGGDHAAAQHDGRQEGLEHQAFAELLHDDHGLDRTAAVAAVGLGKGHAEPAELGHLRPILRQEALLGRDDLAPVLESVLVAHEALRRVLQLLLFVGQGQVHRSLPPKSS